jgi:hypothetical protein
VHSTDAGSTAGCSAVRILETPDELRRALMQASRFDDRTSDLLRTRSERYRALETGITPPATPTRPKSIRPVLADDLRCAPTANAPTTNAPTANAGMANAGMANAGMTVMNDSVGGNETDAMEGRIHLEVYADIWCPFAHVSLRTLKRLRDEISPGTPILVRAWPLELVNGAPLDPAVTAAHVAELRRDVAPELFAGFRPGVMPCTTLNALALVEAVNDADPWSGERISLHLRDLLFEQGRRVGLAQLALLATENGLAQSVLHDIGRVEARLEEGRCRGVKGSPHLFVGQTGFFCPLLDIENEGSGGLRMHERLERLRLLLLGGLGISEEERPSPEPGIRSETATDTF